MEVMGRATEKPWGIVFAGHGDSIARHASPLYEAALEGVLLFVIMLWLWKFSRLRGRAGMLSGMFAMLYAVFRIFAEQFREPDVQLGFLTGWGLTMGQLLSAAMFLAGACVLAASAVRNSRDRPHP
jgi:phosphatidylglycerol:prolipoprotein diacylglycerol transferase